MPQLSVGSMVLILVASLFTAAAAVWDMRQRGIPNALTVPVFLAGWVYQGVFHHWAGLADAGLGFAIVFGTLFIVFGFSALVLSGIGLYGVMAFSVSRRTQEIGVRMALGATGPNVIALVVRQGAIELAIGLTLGLVLGASLARLIAALLFNVKPTDPFVFASIVFVLILTGIAEGVDLSSVRVQVNGSNVGFGAAGAAGGFQVSWTTASALSGNPVNPNVVVAWNSVPGPGSFALLGLAGLVGRRGRRRS